MSIVVRLKHLPDEADSSDIRKFFKKVEIPEGGVRILGGEKGIVYITLESENGKTYRCVTTRKILENNIWLMCIRKFVMIFKKMS